MTAERLTKATDDKIREELSGDVARRDRQRPRCIENAIVRYGDLDRLQRPLVIRDLRRDDALDAEGGIGLGIAEWHVDAEARWRRRPGKINGEHIVVDCHRRDEIERLI